MNDPHAHCGSGGGAAAAQEMVPAGARARVLVLSALAALPAGAGPAGLPKQPLPKLLAATDARVASLAPPGALPRRQPPAAASRALVVARERRLTTDYAQLAKLVAGDAAADDSFGISVAIDGETVIIGATGAGTGGAVYVLRTSDGGATYGEVAKLTASDAAADDKFGVSVAIDGATVVVGAFYGSNNWKGSTYVFLTTDGGATYGQVAKLTAADAGGADNFGWSVAISGDTIVVGAYGDDDGGSASGSAYVFRTSDGGATYDQVTKLTAADAAASDKFGISVAIAGDTVVVGARGDDGNTGSAYVFEDESGWWDYFSSDAAAATRTLPSAMILLAAAAVLAAILA